MRNRHGVSRVLLVAFAAVAVFALGGAAVYFSSVPAGTPSSTSSGQTSPGTPANTIVVATVGQVGDTLDPAAAGSPLAANLVRSLGAGLVDLAPGSGRVVPALALNWSSSAGDTVWTFSLRQGLTFPDGSSLNATDVALSINRTIGYDTGSFASKGYDHFVLGADVLGPYTVRITLSHSAGVDFAADTSLFPVYPSVAEGADIVNYTGNPSTENPNGLGPYLLGNWVKSSGVDEWVALTPNPNYWNRTQAAASGIVRPMNITVVFFSDKASMLASLASGNADLAYVDPAYGGLQSSDVQQFVSGTAYKVWVGPAALGGSDSAVSTKEISGVVMDSTGIFRYSLLTKG